jgi:hypothetical protein
MSKLRHKNDSQLTIFDLIRDYSKPAAFAPGQFRVIDGLRHEMREAIKHCSLSRHQIAGEMSHLLNETITKEQIDSWTREDQRAEIQRLDEEIREAQALKRKRMMFLKEMSKGTE